MSKETLESLNTNTLIGYTDRRGHAWHYRASAQGAESNHYAGAIPVEDVRRRLFGWTALEGQVETNILTDTGVLHAVDTERKAIVRSDTAEVLGVFKSGYRVHQYDEWLIRNVETLLDADLHIGSAGLLRRGAQAWVQIEMADTIQAAEGVEFRPFLTAATSMDGSLATTYLTGAQVVVCDNTLSAALGSAASRFKVKHSSRSLDRIVEARDALGIVYEVADRFSAQVEALVGQVVTDDQWSRFVTAHTNPEGKDLEGRALTTAQRTASELNTLYRHDERVAPWAGTAYGVLAAVNTHAHHFKTVRGASRADRNAERAITGAVDKLDNSTLELLATV